MRQHDDVKSYVRGCSQDHLAGWLWGIEMDLAELPDAPTDELTRKSTRAFLDVRRAAIVDVLRMRERIPDPLAALRPGAARFDLDRIKQDITMLDLAPMLAAVDLRKTGNNFVGRCPFPDHHDSAPSFKVSADGQKWYCWGCGRGGGIFTFCEHWAGCQSFVASVRTAIIGAGRNPDSYRERVETKRGSARVF